MGGTEKLEELESRIREMSSAAFEAAISLTEQGISALDSAREILRGFKMSIETPLGASRAIGWRYLVTMPSTAKWSLDALCAGQWGVSGALLRVLLEEVVGHVYYHRKLEEAFRRVHSGGGREPIDLGQKLKELGWNHDQGLDRLHGELSNVAAHASANVPGWAGEVKNGVLEIGNTPRFTEEGFEDMTFLIQRLLFIGLVDALGLFPELKEGNDDWWDLYVRFTSTLESRVDELEDADEP